jgi:hypothetical protein
MCAPANIKPSACCAVRNCCEKSDDQVVSSTHLWAIAAHAMGWSSGEQVCERFVFPVVLTDERDSRVFDRFCQ